MLRTLHSPRQSSARYAAPLLCLALVTVSGKSVLARPVWPGERYGPFSDCVEGLTECLGAEKDPALREPILRALFAVELRAIEEGGTALGESDWFVRVKTRPEAAS